MLRVEICKMKVMVNIKSETNQEDANTTIEENPQLSKSFNAVDEKLLSIAGAGNITPVIKQEESKVALENPNQNVTKNIKPASKKRHTLASSSAFEALKRRKIKVAGAPKLPLTGYVRFMNDRREQLKRELPNKTALELTRIIAEEWQQLAEERKAPYLESAEIDKQRYMDELNKFLKERPDILASEMAKNQVQQKNKLTKKTNEKSTTLAGSAMKEKPIPATNTTTTTTTTTKKQIDNSVTANNTAVTLPDVDNDELPLAASLRQPIVPKRTPTPTIPVTGQTPTANQTAAIAVCTSGEIPIFTNEFLEHNKIFDMDFRTLRKQRADIEQQNSVLDMHVENTSTGLTKINKELADLEMQNQQLNAYLQQMKQKLVGALSGLSIPNAQQGANADNLDDYMRELHNMATIPNSHVPVLNKARDIMRKLDLPVKIKY